ncbi:RNA methyltransferase PUA domain-containing protein [Deinococcus malanensis]|uniref:RNA methyltransferase PUA domain-containing protein n=1 Tax=Deinococcus malanensis TaxID=1706855 RepID=UPI003626C750
MRVEVLAPEMVLGPREARHLYVLRLSPGAELLVFDGQGAQAQATVAELDAARAVLHLGERSEAASETPQPLTLAVALMKETSLPTWCGLPPNWVWPGCSCWSRAGQMRGKSERRS